MKKVNIKKFDVAYEHLAREKDPLLHIKAVELLLAEIGMEDEFTDALKEKAFVENFFLLWERAGMEEVDPKERPGLKKLGELSKLLYEKSDYRGLCKLFSDVAFRHLANFLRLEERKDFKTITDHDLYTKDFMPPEVYLQFFLIETLAKRNDFDWNRGEEIARQNLICFILCFGDMYEFFHEEEE